jgi:hypothetical protein
MDSQNLEVIKFHFFDYIPKSTTYVQKNLTDLIIYPFFLISRNLNIEIMKKENKKKWVKPRIKTIYVESLFGASSDAPVFSTFF